MTLFVVLAALPDNVNLKGKNCEVAHIIDIKIYCFYLQRYASPSMLENYRQNQRRQRTSCSIASGTDDRRGESPLT